MTWMSVIDTTGNGYFCKTCKEFSLKYPNRWEIRNELCILNNFRKKLSKLFNFSSFNTYKIYYYSGIIECYTNNNILLGKAYFSTDSRDSNCKFKIENYYHKDFISYIEDDEFRINLLTHFSYEYIDESLEILLNFHGILIYAD